MNRKKQGPVARGQGPVKAFDSTLDPRPRTLDPESASPDPGPRTLDPLKILMLAPTPYFSDRGCHVRIFEEAQALMQQGHQVRIVTYHLGRDLPPVPVDRTVMVPWYRKQGAGPSWHKPYLDLLLIGKALTVARSFRPHLIHAHLHEGALVGWVLKQLLRVPLLFDYQGSLSGESLNHGFFKNGLLLHRLFCAIERTINHLPDRIISSSTPGQQELIEQWGIEATKVSALPDGVDTGIFCPFPKEAAHHCLIKYLAPCPLTLDPASPVPVIIYLGLLNRYQGIDLLLEAARELVRRGCSFHLLLMGFPDEAYRSKAAEMGLSGQVSFTGRIDYADAPLLLCAGDIAVSPKISSTEANGKLLNYMACGLPVVCFETPVNRELLGNDGIYATFGDAVHLADRLAAALSEQEGLHLRGERLRQRAVQHHDWHSRAAQLEELYSKMLLPPFP